MIEQSISNCNAVEVSDLTVAYDTRPVLWDIDLELPRGKLAAVIGPNGAGKTTLLKAMLGLLKPITGAVRFTGSDGQTLNRSGSRIGYVPQSESVDWDFPATVLDVVIMGRYGHLGWFRRPGRAERDMALAALDKVSLADFAARQLCQLSGGQQQRVFLARALVQEADIYFMDEPFKGVDARTEQSIVSLLKELKQAGRTIVVVHHDLSTVREYFDWVTLINTRVVANGPVQEVFHEQNLGLAYQNPGMMLQGVAR